jgi:hypothetical protein
MTQPISTNRRSGERGSALLVVVVVMLVLSVVGMAIVTMTEEDRDQAYSEMYTREALYAAEMGLRHGERVLITAGKTAADSLLQHVSAAETPVVSPPVPQYPELTSQYNLEYLGTYLTDGGVELANQTVAIGSGNPGMPAPEGFYSLYVKNNPEDSSVADNNLKGTTTSAKQDDDSIIRLVCVGWVQFGDTVHAVKILEEEYTWVGIEQNPSAQKLADAGGTSSGRIGG